MKPANRAALYRLIWRWHFYAGLFCIPFILALSLTGSIYLFRPQIDALLDSPYNQVDATAARLPVRASTWPVLFSSTTTAAWVTFFPVSRARCEATARSAIC